MSRGEQVSDDDIGLRIAARRVARHLFTHVGDRYARRHVVH
jgi:hypothetical protein